ncbi:MAG: hypothetical protein RL548_589, partial [Bacteroidota bacterium]
MKINYLKYFMTLTIIFIFGIKLN